MGPSRDHVTSLGRLTMVPDMALAELEPADSAMLIMPGGMSWDRGGNTEAAEKAREFLAANVQVAAICGATAGLARAGLLDERAHTSNAKEYLQAAGGADYRGAANYRDAPCVRDRGLITAGSTASVDFARMVFDTLEMYTTPALDVWYGLFSTGEPKYFYALMQAASRT